MKFIFDVTGEKLINCAEISVIEIKNERYGKTGDVDSCSAYARLKQGYELEIEHFFEKEGMTAVERAYEWLEEMRLYLTNNEPWIFG
jgi:hypothetical protein